MSPTTPLHQKPALGATRKPLGQFTPPQATQSQSPFTHGQRLQRVIALKAKAYGDRGRLPFSLSEGQWNSATPATQAVDNLTSPTSQAPTLQQRSDNPETSAPTETTPPNLSAPALQQQPSSPQAPSGEAFEAPEIAEPGLPLPSPTLQQQPDQASGQQDFASGHEPDALPPAPLAAASTHPSSPAPTLQQASETSVIAEPASPLATPAVQQQPDLASDQRPDAPPPAPHDAPSTHQSSAAPTLQQVSDPNAKSLTTPSSSVDDLPQKLASTEALAHEPTTHATDAAQSLASEPAAQSLTPTVTDAHPPTIPASESPSPLESSPSSAPTPALQRKIADGVETQAPPPSTTPVKSAPDIARAEEPSAALTTAPSPELLPAPDSSQPSPLSSSIPSSPVIHPNNPPSPENATPENATSENSTLNNAPTPSFDSVAQAPALQTQIESHLQSKSASPLPADHAAHHPPLTTETSNNLAPTSPIPTPSAPSPLPKLTNPAIPNAPSPIDPIHPQLQAAPLPATAPLNSPAPHPLGSPSPPLPPLPPPSWDNLTQLLTTPTPPEAWASQFDLQPPIAEDLTNPFIPPSAQEPATPAPLLPSSPASPPPGSPANCDPSPEILEALAQATLRWIYNDLTLSQTRHHARTPYPPPWLSQPFLPIHPGHETSSQQPAPDLKQHLQAMPYPDVPQLNALVQELKQRLQSKVACDRDRIPLTTYR